MFLRICIYINVRYLYTYLLQCYNYFPFFRNDCRERLDLNSRFEGKTFIEGVLLHGIYNLIKEQNVLDLDVNIVDKDVSLT